MFIKYTACALLAVLGASTVRGVALDAAVDRIGETTATEVPGGIISSEPLAAVVHNADIVVTAMLRSPQETPRVQGRRSTNIPQSCWVRTFNATSNQELAFLDLLHTFPFRDFALEQNVEHCAVDNVPGTGDFVIAAFVTRWFEGEQGADPSGWIPTSNGGEPARWDYPTDRALVVARVDAATLQPHWVRVNRANEIKSHIFVGEWESFYMGLVVRDFGIYVAVGMSQVVTFECTMEGFCDEEGRFLMNTHTKDQGFAQINTAPFANKGGASMISKAPMTNPRYPGFSGLTVTGGEEVQFSRGANTFFRRPAHVLGGDANQRNPTGSIRAPRLQISFGNYIEAWSCGSGDLCVQLLRGDPYTRMPATTSSNGGVLRFAAGVTDTEITLAPLRAPVSWTNGDGVGGAVDRFYAAFLTTDGLKVQLFRVSGTMSVTPVGAPSLVATAPTVTFQGSTTTWAGDDVWSKRMTRTMKVVDHETGKLVITFVVGHRRGSGYVPGADLGTTWDFGPSYIPLLWEFEPAGVQRYFTLFVTVPTDAEATTAAFPDRKCYFPRHTHHLYCDLGIDGDDVTSVELVSQNTPAFTTCVAGTPRSWLNDSSTYAGPGNGYYWTNDRRRHFAVCTSDATPSFNGVTSYEATLRVTVSGEASPRTVVVTWDVPVPTLATTGTAVTVVSSVLPAGGLKSPSSTMHFEINLANDTDLTLGWAILYNGLGEQSGSALVTKNGAQLVLDIALLRETSAPVTIFNPYTVKFSVTDPSGTRRQTESELVVSNIVFSNDPIQPEGYLPVGCSCPEALTVDYSRDEIPDATADAVTSIQLNEFDYWDITLTVSNVRKVTNGHVIAAPVDARLPAREALSSFVQEFDEDALWTTPDCAPGMMDIPAESLRVSTMYNAGNCTTSYTVRYSLRTDWFRSPYCELREEDGDIIVNCSLTLTTVRAFTLNEKFALTAQENVFYGEITLPKKLDYEITNALHATLAKCSVKNGPLYVVDCRVPGVWSFSSVTISQAPLAWIDESGCTVAVAGSSTFIRCPLNASAPTAEVTTATANVTVAVADKPGDLMTFDVTYIVPRRLSTSTSASLADFVTGISMADGHYYYGTVDTAVVHIDVVDAARLELTEMVLFNSGSQASADVMADSRFGLSVSKSGTRIALSFLPAAMRERAAFYRHGPHGLNITLLFSAARRSAGGSVRGGWAVIDGLQIEGSEEPGESAFAGQPSAGAGAGNGFKAVTVAAAVGAAIVVVGLLAAVGAAVLRRRASSKSLGALELDAADTPIDRV